MLRHLKPAAIKPPFARYSHGVEVPAGKRLVLCAGQLGIGPDDVVPEDAGAQAELCFANIAAILGEAGLSLADIVRINAYVADRAYLKAYMDVRDRLFSDPAPASTLMVVSGFARPEFKVEVESDRSRVIDTKPLAGYTIRAWYRFARDVCRIWP